MGGIPIGRIADSRSVSTGRAAVTVFDVTLWLFGGVTRLGGEAKTPKEAFRIAVCGLPP